MTSQRIIFTVNTTTISRDAARTEISLHDNTLTIYPEGVLPGWTLLYDSPEEARQAFNMTNSRLADGLPLVYVPAQRFTQRWSDD